MSQVAARQALYAVSIPNPSTCSVSCAPDLMNQGQKALRYILLMKDLRIRLDMTVLCIYCIHQQVVVNYKCTIDQELRDAAT